MPPWPSLKVKDGAKYGPLVPTLGAQVFASGLGGGQADWQWGATAHGADLHHITPLQAGRRNDPHAPIMPARSVNERPTQPGCDF